MLSETQITAALQANIQTQKSDDLVEDYTE